jgi:hypothetical protein
MTATILSPPPQRTPRRNQGAVIAGTVLGVVAAAVLVVAGLSFYGNSKTDSAGYIATKSDPYTTSSYALATDDLDIDGTGWLVDTGVAGDIRLRADAHNGKPLFVGIARSTDVDAYLRRSEYAEITDVDYDPFHASYRAHAGAEKPAAPAEQDIWVAQTHGAGTQTLNWSVKDGTWSVVVMNADGSAGVDAGVSAGAKIDWLDTLGWSLLGFGVLLGAGGVTMIVLGARRR